MKIPTTHLLTYFTFSTILIACVNSNSSEAVHMLKVDTIPNESSSMYKKYYNVGPEPITEAQVRFIVAALKVYHSDGKKDTGSTGSGFFIDSIHLVTCYHVFKPKNNWNARKIKILYNIISDDSTRGLPDSTEALLYLPAEKGKYDFSSHKYDENRPVTDLTVLTVKAKNVVPPPKILYAPFRAHEKLFLAEFQPTRQDGDYYKPSIFITFFETSLGKDESLVIGLTEASSGSSGSPLLNGKGEVLGMMVKGIETNAKSLQVLKEAFEKREIAEDDYLDMKESLELNPTFTVGMYVPSKYFRLRYPGYF